MPESAIIKSHDSKELMLAHGPTVNEISVMLDDIAFMGGPNGTNIMQSPNSRALQHSPFKHHDLTISQ